MRVEDEGGFSSEVEVLFWRKKGKEKEGQRVCLARRVEERKQGGGTHRILPPANLWTLS